MIGKLVAATGKMRPHRLGRAERRLDTNAQKKSRRGPMATRRDRLSIQDRQHVAASRGENLVTTS
jgi:hypothetical protein